MSISQNDHLFVGVYREYYQLDKLKSEVFVNAGKKEGEYKLYDSNGQLLSICNYINNKIEGEYKSYWGNGQLSEEVNYIVCFYKTGIGII